MKPGHAAGLAHTDNQANAPAKPRPDAERALFLRLEVRK